MFIFIYLHVQFLSSTLLYEYTLPNQYINIDIYTIAAFLEEQMAAPPLDEDNNEDEDQNLNPTGYHRNCSFIYKFIL